MPVKTNGRNSPFDKEKLFDDNKKEDQDSFKESFDDAKTQKASQAPAQVRKREQTTVPVLKDHSKVEAQAAKIRSKLAKKGAIARNRSRSVLPSVNQSKKQDGHSV